ncbi:MAG TPA: hypothetical protein VFA94_06235 [Acidimicrobiales bacterium]|nr:hypothetical protein [Acidimicrobiales bacterium]
MNEPHETPEYPLVKINQHENQGAGMEAVRTLIQEWRAEAASQVVFSSSRVQDRLFELWGTVRDLPVARQVEAWLTLTLSRELFSGEEIVAFLDEVQANISQPAAASG